MNANFELAYLEGGDDFFGPNLGGAVVATNVRKNYATECPNVGKFLKNLTFTLQAENEIMAAILDEGEKPQAAAKAWIKKNPQALNAWLKGVKPKAGADALKSAIALTE